MSMIAHAQFTLETDQVAHYRAVRDRLNRPRVVPLKAAPVPAVVPEPEPEAEPVYIPAIDLWRLGSGQSDIAAHEQITTAPAWQSKATAKQIVQGIADKHGISVDELMSHSRRRHIVPARQEAMAAIYTAFPLWSLPAIAEYFGGFDHTTCLYAVKKMGAWRGVAA